MCKGGNPGKEDFYKPVTRILFTGARVWSKERKTVPLCPQRSLELTVILLLQPPWWWGNDRQEQVAVILVILRILSALVHCEHQLLKRKQLSSPSSHLMPPNT